jgi:hypothetical protein
MTSARSEGAWIVVNIAVPGALEQSYGEIAERLRAQTGQAWNARKVAAALDELADEISNTVNANRMNPRARFHMSGDGWAQPASERCYSITSIETGGRRSAHDRMKKSASSCGCSGGSPGSRSDGVTTTHPPSSLASIPTSLQAAMRSSRTAPSPQTRSRMAPILDMPQNHNHALSVLRVESHFFEEEPEPRLSALRKNAFR